MEIRQLKHLQPQSFDSLRWRRDNEEENNKGGQDYIPAGWCQFGRGL